MLRCSYIKAQASRDLIRQGHVLTLHTGCLDSTPVQPYSQQQTSSMPSRLQQYVGKSTHELDMKLQHTVVGFDAQQRLEVAAEQRNDPVTSC
jgi:hypothetical protein